MTIKGNPGHRQIEDLLSGEEVIFLGKKNPALECGEERSLQIKLGARTAGGGHDRLVESVDHPIAGFAGSIVNLFSLVCSIGQGGNRFDEHLVHILQ